MMLRPTPNGKFGGAALRHRVKDDRPLRAEHVALALRRPTGK